MLERHIQATARGAAGAGSRLEEQEVEQPGAEQVLHLPLEPGRGQVAGESVGPRDRWKDGSGGKKWRTGWKCFPQFSFQCIGSKILKNSHIVTMSTPRPTPLDKFAETGWRWLFYFAAHVVRSKVSTNQTVAVVFMWSGLKFQQIKLWWWFSCGQV